MIPGPSVFDVRHSSEETKSDMILLAIKCQALMEPLKKLKGICYHRRL